ncbi:MAG: N-succinylarginine dihydrolase [Litorimonas sp.]
MKPFFEINFDGLVGPTHNYAGLSHGNLASGVNKGRASNPRAAAMQGLSKMRHLLSLGIAQGVLPPHERPFMSALRQIGYAGNDGDIVETACRDNPALLANMSSASCMWTANAATVSPSPDTGDGRVHLTAANLTAMPHRALEGPQTHRTLKTIFKDDAHFAVHEALPHGSLFGDEGAANHNRLAAHHGAKGLELFVHGRQALSGAASLKFPARQTLEASQAVARLHGLDDKNVIHAVQSPAAINAGAFHNDVVCVTNGNVLFFHEDAFANIDTLRSQIQKQSAVLGFEPVFLMAPRADVPLSDAVKSYLFNSQLITKPNGAMHLILPIEAEDTPSAKAFVETALAADGPLDGADYLDLRQSMSNGGGPACLRLRVQVNAAQHAAIEPAVVMNADKITALEVWVQTHYRDRLELNDLGDRKFLVETRTALDELTQLLNLGALYDFQR